MPGANPSNTYITDDTYGNIIDTWQDQWFQMMMTSDQSALDAAQGVSGDFFGGFQELWNQEQSILKGAERDLFGNMVEEAQTAGEMIDTQRGEGIVSGMRGIGTASLDEKTQRHREEMLGMRRASKMGRETIMSDVFDQGFRDLHGDFYSQGDEHLLGADWTWKEDNTTEGEWDDFIQDEDLSAIAELEDLSYAWFSGDFSQVEGMLDLEYDSNNTLGDILSRNQMDSEGFNYQGDHAAAQQFASQYLIERIWDWFETHEDTGGSNTGMSVHGITFKDFMKQLGVSNIFDYDSDTYGEWDEISTGPTSNTDIYTDQYGYWQYDFENYGSWSDWAAEELGFGIGSDYMVGQGAGGIQQPYNYSSDWFDYSPDLGITGDYSYNTGVTPINIAGGEGVEPVAAGDSPSLLYTDNLDWWSRSGMEDL